MAMIFQEPMSSLNPAFTIGAQPVACTAIIFGSLPVIQPISFNS